VGRLARFTEHEHRAIQQQCLAGIPKTAARRGAVIPVLLALVGFALGSVALHYEAQIQQLERSAQSW
jgi:hypothetical protein